MSTQSRFMVSALSLVALVASACTGTGNATGNQECTPPEQPVITFAAYSNVYDAYGKLTSAFQSQWSDEHDGQTVIFQTSYGGSTTQAENIVNGFPADVFASSLAPDVRMIEDAGLVTHDLQNDTDGGMVATSAVVFDVRPGNPLNIDDWDDLAQPGLEILTPDPAQSGGARWNIVAAYGAAMRGNVPGYRGDDPAEAGRLLEGIFSNVTVLDKSANDSIKNFESGNGDVAITYEYAALQAQAAGEEDEIVYPPSTVAIETPVVVVDQNAQQHCVEDIAKEFVEFLHTPDAQSVFHDVGYERPIDIATAQKGDGDFLPEIPDFFSTEELGGWDGLDQTVFGDDGVFTRAFEAAQG
jgi:sulfate/thiosulfate transport system substrate-binding protein